LFRPPCLLAVSLHHPDLPSFPTRRSSDLRGCRGGRLPLEAHEREQAHRSTLGRSFQAEERSGAGGARDPVERAVEEEEPGAPYGDRKSTRLNSSHQIISYAVFCLKKKK